MAYRERAIVLAHASATEYVGDLVRNEAAGRPLPTRARRVAENVLGGKKRFQTLVALQCEAADRLAGRLGMNEGVRGGLAHFYARWDGKGMPGVAGDDISLAQRVVTVAYDAVAFARLEGETAALDLIARRRGSAYDPEVCDALSPTSSLSPGAPLRATPGSEPSPPSRSRCGRSPRPSSTRSHPAWRTWPT